MIIATYHLRENVDLIDHRPFEPVLDFLFKVYWILDWLSGLHLNLLGGMVLGVLMRKLSIFIQRQILLNELIIMISAANNIGVLTISFIIFIKATIIFILLDELVLQKLSFA